MRLAACLSGTERPCGHKVKDVASCELACPTTAIAGLACRCQQINGARFCWTKPSLCSYPSGQCSLPPRTQIQARQSRTQGADYELACLHCSDCFLTTGPTCRYKHVDCVRELLDRGADPTTRSFMGSSAQDYGSDHSEIHRLLDQATQQWLADRGLSQQQQPAHIAGNGLGPATVRGGGGGQATSDAGSSRTEASHPFSQSPHGAPQTGSTPSPKASQLSTSPHNSNYSSQGPTQAQQVPLPAMSGPFTASGSYPGQTGMAGSMGRSSSTSHQQPGSLGAGGEQPPHQGGQLHANAPSFGMSEMGLHQAPYGARQGGQEFPQPGGYGGQPQYEHGAQRGQLGGMSGNQHQQGRGGGGLRPMQQQPQMAMYSQMPSGAPGGPGPVSMPPLGVHPSLLSLAAQQQMLMQQGGLGPMQGGPPPQASLRSPAPASDAAEQVHDRGSGASCCFRAQRSLRQQCCVLLDRASAVRG